jgi:hypothetical protein
VPARYVSIFNQIHQCTFVTASPPDVRRRLCPAVGALLLSWGSAPRRPLPKQSKRVQDPGRSPNILEPLTAGQSHRLTSSGEAEAEGWK